MLCTAATAAAAAAEAAAHSQMLKSDRDNKFKVGSNLPVIVRSSWTHNHRSLLLRHVDWNLWRCHVTASPLGNRTTTQIGRRRYGRAAWRQVGEWPWGVVQVTQRQLRWKSPAVCSEIEKSRTGSFCLPLDFPTNIKWTKALFKIHVNHTHINVPQKENNQTKTH